MTSYFVVLYNMQYSLEVVSTFPVAKHGYCVGHHPYVPSLAVEVRFWPVSIFIENINAVLCHWRMVHGVINAVHSVAWKQKKERNRIKLLYCFYLEDLIYFWFSRLPIAYCHSNLEMFTSLLSTLIFMLKAKVRERE